MYLCACLHSSFFVVVENDNSQVAPDTCYAAVMSFFTEMCPRLGIDVSLVATNDIDAYRKAVRPNTVVSYVRAYFMPL